MVKGFKLVGIGGTFDRLHLGHERMLKIAFKVGQRVKIGLVVKEALGVKEYLDSILPYETRKATLIKFLESNGYSKRAEIVKIDDPLGNFKGKGGADKDKKLEAILVSAEHKVSENAFTINKIRADNQLKPICIIGVPLVEVDGAKVSSSLIRRLVVEKAGERVLSKYTHYSD